MNQVTDVATYAFIVAGILVLTRPGSQGPKLLNALFGGFAHVTQAASGQKVSR